MKEETTTIKSKRLKAIRILMYLDALLVLITLAMMAFRDFEPEFCAGCYIRIIVLAIIYIILYFTEKKLSRYLRKHQEGGE